MRTSFFTLICAGLLFIVPISLSGALEIGFTAGIDNVIVHPDKLSGTPSDNQFQNYPFAFGEVYVKGFIAGDTGFNINLSRDSILRNRLSTAISANYDFINVEFGPFVGMDDEFGRPDIGVIGGFDLFYPGVIVLSFRGSSTLSGLHEIFGENSSGTLDGKIGFWMANVLPSFNASLKTYSKYYGDDFEANEISDDHIRLFLSADFYAKYAPITLRFDGGYQILKRTYYSKDEDPITDELTSFFAGFELNWQITKPVGLTAAFEVPFLLNVAKPMEPPESYLNQVKFRLGLSYTFF